jgi:hypothetical protein
MKWRGGKGGGKADVMRREASSSQSLLKLGDD